MRCTADAMKLPWWTRNKNVSELFFIRILYFRGEIGVVSDCDEKDTSDSFPHLLHWATGHGNIYLQMEPSTEIITRTRMPGWVESICCYQDPSEVTLHFAWKSECNLGAGLLLEGRYQELGEGDGSPWNTVLEWASTWSWSTLERW